MAHCQKHSSKDLVSFCGTSVTTATSPKMQKNKTRGFTLLEVLIVISVLAILTGISVSALAPLRQTLGLEDAGQNFLQDTQFARSRAMTSGNTWQVRITSSSNYIVEEQIAGSWTQRRQKTLGSSLQLSNVSANDAISFDTRGFATLSISGSLPGEVRITGSNGTLRIFPTLVGAVRMVKL